MSINSMWLSSGLLRSSRRPKNRRAMPGCRGFHAAVASRESRDVADYFHAAAVGQQFIVPPVASISTQGSSPFGNLPTPVSSRLRLLMLALFDQF